MNKTLAKLLGFSLIFLLFSSIPLISQENNTKQNETKKFKNESDLYYYNFPILKIAQHKMGYYIIYRRQGSTVTGECFLPHAWFKPKDKRGILDITSGDMRPYMSVVYKNGEFDHVRLITPHSNKHPSWAIISNNAISNDKFEIESLDIQF